MKKHQARRTINNRSVHNSSGAVLTEYAIAALVLIPILAGLALLYNWSPDDGNHEGAIVDRGEQSLTPSKTMSPAKESLCTAGSDFIAKELCF